MQVTPEFLREQIEKWYLPGMKRNLADARNPKLIRHLCYDGASSYAMLAAVCYARLNDQDKALEYFTRAAQYGRHCYNDQAINNGIMDTLEYSIISHDNKLRRKIALETKRPVERMHTHRVIPYIQALRLLILKKTDPRVEEYATQGIELFQVRRKWLNPMHEVGELLKALNRKNERTFNRHLRKLLEIHHKLVNWGEYRDSISALSSIHGVALSRLAVERGMRVHAESIYLPKFLIE